MKCMRVYGLIIGFIFGAFYPLMSTAKAAQPDSGARYATIEIRYYAPEAGKVDFVWGINGWQTVAEEFHLAGTAVQDGVMLTPMRPQGERFDAEIRVPVGASVQYGFSIKETADGRSVNVWDKGRDVGVMNLSVQPVLISSYDKVFEVEAAVDLKLTFITQVIVYRQPDASQVTMVWGINDWETVPYAADAPDTEIKGDMMHTTMHREGEDFQASIQVQKESLVRFGFNYLESEGLDNDKPKWLYDGNYFLVAKKDGVPEIIDFQEQIMESGAVGESEAEESQVKSLFVKHWPLLLVGILISLGIIIGFRNN